MRDRKREDTPRGLKSTGWRSSFINKEALAFGQSHSFELNFLFFCLIPNLSITVPSMFPLLWILIAMSSGKKCKKKLWFMPYSELKRVVSFP